jgi:hypothetical protein
MSGGKTRLLSSYIQDSVTAAFNKSIYRQMCSEFRKLYAFLVDSEHNSAGFVISQQGGMYIIATITNLYYRL